MRRIKTKSIKGYEILAKDIYSSSGLILISEGTILKKEYIEKLLELKITDVFVEDEISRDIQIKDITEEEINKQCYDTLRSVIERCSICSKKELEELSKKTMEVMEKVLLQKEIVYIVSNVRNYSKSLYEHSLNVASLSILLAIRAGYSKEQIKEIAMGALLHDVGFISVKEKYQGIILEESEEHIQKEIKRHVVYGYIELEQQEWLSSVSKEIILYHHERLDRSGYPFHMTENKLRPQVRLVSICDAFDSMVYGNLENRVKVHQALEKIANARGSKFDAELVDLFTRLVAPYPTGVIVSLSNGEFGMVLKQNPQMLDRPLVRIVEQNRYGEWVRKQERDLSKQLSLFVKDTIE